MNRTVSKYRKYFPLFIFIIMLGILPFLISLISKSQENRSQAIQTTNLSIQPTSSLANPIQKTVGETFNVDLYISPQNDTVSFLKFEILYDATKLSVSGANALFIDTTVFPAKLEGPVFTTGRIAAAIGIGSDPTKGITSSKKFATITFTALQQTTSPVEVRYGSNTVILSIGPNQEANSNVLLSTIPAFVMISGGGSNVTPTVRPTTTPSPRPTTTPVIPTSGPTPTQSPEGFRIVLKLLMHGIGAAGDSANPQANTLSNKNPIHQERLLNIQIVNSDNELVSTKIVPAFYNSDDGTFFSHVDMDQSLPPGEYVIKAKTDRYLRKLMPGFFTIKPGEKTTIPNTFMVAGDVNGDNQLNILDYNILYDCGYGAINALPMIHPNSIFKSPRCQDHVHKENADLTDDGKVSATDYNLLLRELSVQVGE